MLVMMEQVGEHFLHFSYKPFVVGVDGGFLLMLTLILMLPWLQLKLELECCPNFQMLFCSSRTHMQNLTMVHAVS